MSSRRSPIAGRYTAEEVALAARNRGMPLEALRHEVTPPGLHYLLIHFDIPHADGGGWRLELHGLVRKPCLLSLSELKALPATTLRVTMECAGNGRGQLSPRYPSVPWLEEGVSTADWTGVRLALVLEKTGLLAEANEIVFHGADSGIDAGVEHHFARSLSRAQALDGEALVAYEMNGAPLPPQHGAPLRLVVPRWYGMASVKWLRSIEAIAAPFEGLQQARSYHFRRTPDEKGEPCTLIRVNSLMAPPGIPDFYTRRRIVEAGPVAIVGRAWSGAAPIERVEFGIDGAWSRADVAPGRRAHCWQEWNFLWQAAPGEHNLACRATDAVGNTQPLEPPWDLAGFGNNGVQRIRVAVRS
ncbi:MAG TPA: sulfite oxidase [Burkholderiales bacterium]|nr:sulfite oxidase [Burkholderiales bacterium]